METPICGRRHRTSSGKRLVVAALLAGNRAISLKLGLQRTTSITPQLAFPQTKAIIIGETVNAGGTVHIQWQAQGISRVSISLSSGNFGYDIATNIDATSGSYDWAIPSDFFLKNVFLLPGNNFKVFVYNYLGESGGDNVKNQSDKNFSLIGTTFPTCTDTDGGKKYDIKGTVFGLKDSVATEASSSTDYCSNQNTLIEYSCTFNYYQSQDTHPCPYGCSNGACNAEPIITTQ